MVSATNRNSTVKVLKNFGERIFYPITDRLSEARIRSQFLTFPHPEMWAILAELGRETIDAPGGRLARVRYAPDSRRIVA